MRADISKLSPKPGDIILVRYENDINAKELQEALFNIGPKLVERDIMVVVLRKDKSMEVLDEETMSANGWYKTTSVNGMVRFMAALAIGFLFGFVMGRIRT